MPEWLGYANSAVQFGILLGLLWYAAETLQIRKTSQAQITVSQAQVEAAFRPCVVLSTTEREFEDAVIERDGTASTIVVAPCRDNVIQIRNIGIGPAINITYDIRRTNEPAHGEPRTGYVAAIPKDGTFRLPVPRAFLQNYEATCVFRYRSVSEAEYRTEVNVRNLVLLEMRFPRP